MKTLGAGKGFFIIPHGDRFALSASVDAIGLHDFLQLLPEPLL
jgi:hypothetical protein